MELKGTEVLNFTDIPHNIEFIMINLFPNSNFKKIEEYLIFRTYLDACKSKVIKIYKYTSHYWIQHDWFDLKPDFKEIEESLILGLILAERGKDVDRWLSNCSGAPLGLALFKDGWF